ncbi:hypothetical protein [Cupriavidus sp. CP313]
MLRKLVVVLGAWVLAGCAMLDLSGSKPVALQPDETLVLLAARVQNTREPKYPFTSFRATFAQADMNGFAKKALEPASSQMFLLAAKVKAGANELTTLHGVTERTPVLDPGGMAFAVSGKFNAVPGQVQYLGFLDIENVDRTDDGQQPSGPGIPIIAQALTGLAQGTLAVRLADSAHRDIPQFKQAFPAIADADVVVMPLQQLMLMRSSVNVGEPIVVTREKASLQ